MKICFFVGFYPYIKGGAEYQMKLIAEELSKDVDAFFISVGHTEDNIFYEGKLKVYALKLSNYCCNKALLYYPFFYRIQRIIDAEAPDLVYQRILNSFTYHLAIYTKRNKIPFYVHIADCYSLQFTNTFTDLVRKLMFKSVLKSDVRFIVQTDEQIKLLSRWNVTPVLKIYNLHPLGQQQVLLSHSSERRNIMWIGSARKVKRLDLFFDLAYHFRQNTSWNFVVIGRLESGEYANALSLRMSMLDNIDYLGEQDNEFINRYLEESATILVNTSDSEGFSNTFIQAWLRGVPVVSLNSDPDNILTDCDFGIFCAGDIEKMFDAVELLLSNNDLINKYTTNAFLKAPSLFSLKTNIVKIRHLLKIE